MIGREELRSEVHEAQTTQIVKQGMLSNSLTFVEAKLDLSGQQFSYL